MDGRLKQTFFFEPTQRGDCQTALNFKVLAVGRFEDDEDTRDLIAKFSTADDGPQGIQIPVVINWDPIAERYNARGLLGPGPGIAMWRRRTRTYRFLAVDRRRTRTPRGPAELAP
jgi:hypothetical protein